jgi:hypothetical protein
MKIRGLLTAGMLLTGFVGPAFAMEHSTQAVFFQLGDGFSSRGLVQKVVCDPNGDGKQANCMRECEEEEIRSRETYHTRSNEDRMNEKMACNKKCGC